MSDLDSRIDQHLPPTDSVSIDQALLDSVFTDLFGAQFAESTATQYTSAVREVLGASSTELEARSGGWTFHVSRAFAQSTFSGVAMGLALKLATSAPIALALIPAIIPYMFQVEKTQLRMRDEELLLVLHRSAESKTPDELLASLPQELRDQVNRLDLLDFLEAVTQTGHAKEVERGRFELRHPDHPRLVINLK